MEIDEQYTQTYENTLIPDSLNYHTIHTSLRKIFQTRSTDVVKDCMLIFNCPLYFMFVCYYQHVLGIKVVYKIHR